MYCKKCGKELPDDARFCPECGGQVMDDAMEQKKEEDGRESQVESYNSNTQMRMIKTGFFILLGVMIVVVIACFAHVSKKGREAELRAVQEEKEKAEEQAKEAEAARIQAEEEKKAAQEEAAQAKESAKESTKETDGEKPVSTVNNYYYYQGSHYGEHDYYDNVQVDGYLWPTDEYYLTYSDLEGMDQDTVDAIRNEIYARHGYAFEKKRWRDYFGSKSWYYRDNSCTQDIAKSRMNSIEKANLETIVDYEKSMGWR